MHIPARRLRASLQCLFASILFAVCSAISPAAEPADPDDASRPAVAFNVPAGDAALTLKQFSAQARVPLLYAPDDVRGVSTHAVHATCSAFSAVQRMLADTRLVARLNAASGAIAIVPAPPPPSTQGGAQQPAPTRSPSAMTHLRTYSLPLLAALTASASIAQTPAPQDETVVLSPFTVAGEVMGRYEATEAASGTRIRVSLMDSPQSVTVITRELIEDVGATRLLDAAKYSAGITESTIPNAQDRTNLRGFQTDGATIDGFNFFSFSNLDPVIVDRLEIVKGPDAILSPQIVSGTINVVSKKPLFSDQGYADIQLGRYDADRAEIDVNRVLVPNQIAVRVVAAADHSHDLATGNFNHSQIVMPMVTFRFPANTQITAQAQVYNSYDAAYGGVPLAFTVGTNDKAVLFPGIPENLDFYGTEIARHAQGQHFRIFAETHPTDEFSARLALNTIHWTGDSVGLSLGNPINPATGSQVPETGGTGIVLQNPATGAWYWGGATIPNPIFNEQSATTPYAAGTWAFQTRRYLNLQNDYTYQVKWGATQSTTLAGFMVDYLSNPGWGYPFGMPNMNVPNFTLQPLTVSPVVTSDTRSINWDSQFYATEQLSFVGDRLIVTGGLARSFYRQYTNDLYHGATSQNKVQANLPMGSVLLKPIPEVALFADFSRQAQPNGTSPATGTNPTTTGKQWEAGVRTQLLEKRIYATLTYYDITQNNFSIPNQANATVPPPNPPFPPIFTDRKVTGVEFETSSAITDALSLVGNVAYTHARTPLGQVFRGVADKTAAGFLDYAFGKATPLAGLSVGAGIDYISRRAGDNPNPGGFLTGSTTGNLIIGQPTFWLPARTLVSVMANYRLGEHWKFQLNVDNLLNTHYLAASTSRNNVFPGTSINPRGTVSYKF